MRRRIDVRAVLPGHLVDRGAETVVLDGVGLLRFRVGGGRHPGLAEAGPDWRRGVEAVREIDELFVLNDAIGALERARGKRGCAERSGKRCEGKDGDNAKHRCHDGLPDRCTIIAAPAGVGHAGPGLPSMHRVRGLLTLRCALVWPAPKETVKTQSLN
jgi:hypothetical protein